jgi:hypothetical protein
MTSEISKNQMDMVVDSVMRADVGGLYDDTKRELFGADGDKWMLDCVLSSTKRANPGPPYICSA